MVAVGPLHRCRPLMVAIGPLRRCRPLMVAEGPPHRLRRPLMLVVAGFTDNSDAPAINASDERWFIRKTIAPFFGNGQPAKPALGRPRAAQFGGWADPSCEPALGSAQPN